MINRDDYWAEHADERAAAVALAQLMTGQATTGAEYAACARFIVGAGIVHEAGGPLWTLIMQRIQTLRNNSASQEALADAAHLGEAMRLLIS